MIENHILEQLVEQSAWCQRNWDLSKSIPERDIKTFKYIVKTCPSKQNRVFYKAVFIQDRDIIERIHSTSDSFTVSYNPHVYISNPQILANLVIVFVSDRNYNEKARTGVEYDMGIVDGKDNTRNKIAKQDEEKSVGIAIGYLTLAANILGYRTGVYNAQHRSHETKKILDIDHDIISMIGIGYHNHDKNIRQHHYNDRITYPSFEKSIEVIDK